MGNPNSKRARRRARARNENDQDLVWWAGRWMVRIVTEEGRIDLGNGLYAEPSNESWHESP